MYSVRRKTICPIQKIYFCCKPPSVANRRLFGCKVQQKTREWDEKKLEKRRSIRGPKGKLRIWASERPVSSFGSSCDCPCKLPDETRALASFISPQHHSPLQPIDLRSSPSTFPITHGHKTRADDAKWAQRLDRNSSSPTRASLCDLFATDEAKLYMDADGLGRIFVCSSHVTCL
jgi:hypothetical protein